MSKDDVPKDDGPSRKMSHDMMQWGAAVHDNEIAFSWCTFNSNSTIWHHGFMVGITIDGVMNQPTKRFRATHRMISTYLDLRKADLKI